MRVFAQALAVATCWVQLTEGRLNENGRQQISFDSVGDSLGGPCKTVNNRPIVGILTQPDDDGSEYEYIAGSYVKYLEAAGARVVPVRFSASEEELRRVFDGMNGLFFPGGDNALTPGKPFYDAAEKLFKWALEENEKGVYFPVWGTCLGFELLHILASGNNVTVLDAGGKYDAENFPSPVTFNSNTKGSEMFGNLPRRVAQKLEREPITFNAHQAGIDPVVFAQNEKLSSFFSDIATYVDRNGKPFVAAVEGRNGLPVYGTQFHPEKTIFEWHLPSEIPHEPDSIYLSQYLADFFVSRARCNNHKFPGGFEEEQKRIIQVSRTKYKVIPSGYFTEIYYF